MWNNHTDNSFHYSMNIMEYIAKKNWVSLIKYNFIVLVKTFGFKQIYKLLKDSILVNVKV